MGEEEKRQYNLGILILLVVLCWPAALIYYFTRPEGKVWADKNLPRMWETDTVGIQSMSSLWKGCS